MINRDDIEAGDKVFTRDGGCLVARLSVHGDVLLGAVILEDFWCENGAYHRNGTNPLDIIRIEKAPKPAVEEVWLGSNVRDDWEIIHISETHEWKRAMKLTIINGQLEKWEQVK